MSFLALTDAFIYTHGHDFTGDTNQLTLTSEVAALDRTTFRSNSWTELKGGLKTNQFAMSGFWQAGADSVDSEAFGDLGVVNRVFTIGPDETEGGTAYLFQAGHFNYQLFGQLGELAPFSLTSHGTDGVGVVRGQLAVAKQTVDATGVLGTVVNLGAVGADQYLYATVHVLGTPGTSIELDIESDSASNFPSATSRATVGPLSAAGGTWMTRVAGAITDTHFRVNVTAIDGEFEIAVAIGVQ